MGSAFHVFGSTLIDVKDAVEINLHDSIPFFLVHRVKRLGTASNTRIGKTAVHPAMFSQSVSKGLLDSTSVGNVADLRTDSRAVLPQDRQRFSIFIGIRSPDRNFTTLSGQTFSHTEANAAVTPGNQSNSTFKIKQILYHSVVLRLRWMSETPFDSTQG